MNDAKKNIEPTIELPKYLYHYTSQKGLLGILRSNKLWMTNILYLNDSSEFTYTLDLVRSELKRHIDECLQKLTSVTKLFDKTYGTYYSILEKCDAFPNNTEDECFIFSLSRKKNDLNQWRGYCPKEGGFCIEFDTTKLLSLINSNAGYEIKECIYEPEQQEKLIKPILDKIKINPEIIDVTSFSNEIYKITLRMSSYIKNESFRDERECRIIYYFRCGEKKEYREGKSMIISYIEFSPVDDNKLPVSKIIIGPTPHPELSQLSVRRLLESNGYKTVEVEISKIPYRSW